MRQRVTFSGQVQGVGFRSVAKHAAKKFNVAGWVKNNPDGTVTLVLEGQRRQIGIVINYLKSFFRGNIKRIIARKEKEEGLQGFEIKI